MVQRGKIPAYKVGRQCRFKKKLTLGLKKRKIISQKDKK